jgi:HlyD family secretion protein
MFKNKKRTYLILAIVIVALIVAGVLRKGSGTTTTKIVVATAELNDITESVSANGKIQPERDVIINSDVAGQIVDLFVKEGDTVPKGTLLLRINPDLFESALSRSEAALNNARAALATARARNTQSNAQFVQAQKSYDRNTNLHKSGAISDAEYEQAVSAFEVAKAEVEAAEQSVEAAKFNVASAQATRNEAADNLKRTSIFAPSDGIVSGLAKEKGESVLGTQQMSPTEIMHISDLNTMQVNVDVNESDIIRLSLGDTALIEVDAYLERKFKGVVTEIANAAKNVSAMSTDQVTNFQVKIRILKSSYEDLISEKSSWPFRPGNVGYGRNINAHRP